MNTNIKSMGLVKIGLRAGLLNLSLVASSLAAATDDENALANRLKAFNTTEVVSVEKLVAAKVFTEITKKEITKKRRRSSGRACYQSSASVLRARAEDYQPYIRANSKRYGVDESLIISVITAESCFAQGARSPKGAQGLMQLIPATAERFGVSDVYQPAQNIKGGTRYLKFLLKRFSGNLEYAIAGYNAGEGAVDRYSGIPPYRETKEYVRRVMAVYHRLNGTVPSLSQHTRLSAHRAVLQGTQKKRGYFIKPDYKWRQTPSQARAARSRVSKTYSVAARNNVHQRSVCKDTPSMSVRRATNLIKRTTFWKRHLTVKQAMPLSTISRATGVPFNQLLNLNRGISRFSVKAGTQVLIWQCIRR